MTKIEELFQLTYKHGLTLTSKKGPHGRWVMAVEQPEAVRLKSDPTNSLYNRDVCYVIEDTPEAAASSTLRKVKNRLADLGISIE